MASYLPLNNRKILVCVTGGIAAYKVPQILRSLIQAGAQVRVMMSRAAEGFVTPMVLATLTHQRVWREEDFLSEERGWEIPHITMADWADCVLVAPCTAERLSRLAAGGAGTLIDATVLATRAPVLLCPAMNTHMLSNEATQANLALLASRGFRIVDPDSGDLACGYSGSGRLPEGEAILEELCRALSDQDLAGRTVLITAGPTREFLDPVRFISNPSTGKMGYALARSARFRGARVILVSGPVELQPPRGVETIPVVSALEMFQAVQDRLAESDLVVACAAVSDYRSETASDQKIKREGQPTVTRTFVQNPDIAAWVGSHKGPGQVLVGFAAETQDLRSHALAKMDRKGLDLIAANDLTAPGAGFGVDSNRVSLYGRDGSETILEGSKDQVAWEILSRAAALLVQ